MSSCNHNCSTCSHSDCKDRKESMIEKQNENSNIKKVIAVVSGKGGVGKSLVTALSASAINKKGYHTAVLDADITGPSMGKVFGVSGEILGDGKYMYPAETQQGLKLISVNMMLENDEAPVVWRGPMIANMVKQFWTDVAWGDVDYVFVDMPPGTGDVPLTVFQSLPVDGIILVTSPQDLVSMIVAKAINMANMMNVPIIGVVENMSYFVCDKCGQKHYIYGESKTAQVCKKYNLKLIASLPIDQNFARLCDEGKAYEIEFEQANAITDAILTATKK